MQQHGIHHVTAIAGAAWRNLRFYRDTLGLRLVKKTVNFDDPYTYHLYYGDEAGQPGTILTFFPWEHAASGRVGVGEAVATVLRVPQRAIGFWVERFVAAGVPHEAPATRFGETMLAFKDPDGMALALAGVPGAEVEPAWRGVGIPPEHAIRGLHGVSLLVATSDPTAAILTDVLGFAETGSDGASTRFAAPGAAVGGIVELRAAGELPPGRLGRGSVHHVAFRAASDEVQAVMARRLIDRHGIRPTAQKDRNYFRSIYFREPGGVLFEVATDDPGFAVDEPMASLGSALKLPPGLEGRRAAIESALPAMGREAP